MRVMILVKATESSEQGESPEPWSSEMMAAMGRFNDELRAAGIFVMAAGLQPSSAGARIFCNGTGRETVAGPFANPSELIAGFWIWEVSSMDEAMEWARRCPNPMPVPSWLEIRPMH